jgi:hypothetical protein
MEDKLRHARAQLDCARTTPVGDKLAKVKRVKAERPTIPCSPPKIVGLPTVEQDIVDLLYARNVRGEALNVERCTLMRSLYGSTPREMVEDAEQHAARVLAWLAAHETCTSLYGCPV